LRPFFTSLREHLQITTHKGDPVSYDAALGEWNPSQPLGTLSFANYPCGSTLSISSEDMPAAQMLQLLDWARSETVMRGINMQELLRHLRDKIDKQVFKTPEGGGYDDRS
jgi:hypothetical protein